MILLGCSLEDSRKYQGLLDDIFCSIGKGKVKDDVFTINFRGATYVGNLKDYEHFLQFEDTQLGALVLFENMGVLTEIGHEKGKILELLGIYFHKKRFVDKDIKLMIAWFDRFRCRFKDVEIERATGQVGDVDNFYSFNGDVVKGINELQKLRGEIDLQKEKVSEVWIIRGLKYKRLGRYGLSMTYDVRDLIV